MSTEIKLTPALQKTNVNNIRTSSQNLHTITTDYDEGQTILEAVTLAKQNMIDLQSVVTEYKTLVETNTSQIESLIDQFSQAEQQVAEGITRG